MKQFKSYAQKPFSYILVGKEKIRKFGENHIIALEKAGIAEFAAILAAIKSLYNIMFGNITSRDQMEAQRQAATIQLNQKAEEFKTLAIEIEPLVAFKLKKLGFYEEFYPHGASEIHKMTQANALTLMLRFENFSLTHETALGTPYSDIFKAIRLGYEDAVNTQKGLIGSVKLNTPEFEAAKDEFFDQIYKNILTIAAYYYKTPEKMLAFFDESILEVRKHTADDEGEQPLLVEIPPLTTKTPNLIYSVTDTILLSNVSTDTSIFYYGANTPDEAPKTAPIEIFPGDEVEIPATDLGKYLVLVNHDTVKTAEVEIMLV